MEVEQFPDKEVTKVHTNVFIHHAPYISKEYPDGIFRVYFNVGVQYFQIGVESDTFEDAEFTAKMLVKAIKRMIDESAGCESVQGSK